MKCPHCNNDIELKTTPQIKYVHKLIADYLTGVLYESGNIPVGNTELAKCWLKEFCGFGEMQCFKFKGENRNRFIYHSFRDATKDQMRLIIDAIGHICALGGVIIPETKENV